MIPQLSAGHCNTQRMQKILDVTQILVFVLQRAEKELNLRIQSVSY
jgi:hypothetical protein